VSGDHALAVDRAISIGEGVHIRPILRGRAGIDVLTRRVLPCSSSRGAGSWAVIRKDAAQPRTAA